MAWIESHQALGDHPKTRKAAHLLKVSLPAMVGHLQYLWWWAIDYAEDGKLDRFDDVDLSIAARWEGEVSEFVSVLIAVGFLDEDRSIHDWDDYAGKLIERRKANAARMREARAGQEHKESNARANHVQRTPHARVERPLNQPTVNQPTKPGDTPLPPSSSVQPFDLFEAFCDEIGQQAAEVSEEAKKPQLAAAKTLVKAGAVPDDVRKMTRWLSGQPWVIKGGGLDMKLLAGQHGKWQVNGRPESPPTVSDATYSNGSRRMTGSDFADMLRNLKE